MQFEVETGKVLIWQKKNKNLKIVSKSFIRDLKRQKLHFQKFLVYKCVFMISDISRNDNCFELLNWFR